MLQSINQLSHLTGLDRRTVTKRLATLTPKDGPKGAHQYDAPDALRLILCPSWGTEAGPLDPQTERARLDRARREEIEQRLAEKSRELIPADEVASAWEAQVRIARARLLAMPGRLAHSIVRCKDMREAERLVKQEVHAAITELADGAQDKLDAADGAPD